MPSHTRWFPCTEGLANTFEALGTRRAIDLRLRGVTIQWGGLAGVIAVHRETEYRNRRSGEISNLATCKGLYGLHASCPRSLPSIASEPLSSQSQRECRSRGVS